MKCLKCEYDKVFIPWGRWENKTMFRCGRCKSLYILTQQILDQYMPVKRRFENETE